MCIKKSEIKEIVEKIVDLKERKKHTEAHNGCVKLIVEVLSDNYDGIKFLGNVKYNPHELRIFRPGEKASNWFEYDVIGFVKIVGARWEQCPTRFL